MSFKFRFSFLSHRYGGDPFTLQSRMNYKYIILIGLKVANPFNSSFQFAMPRRATGHALSNKEHQQRHRDKLKEDRQKHENYKQRQRVRWAIRGSEGKLRRAGDFSRRELKSQREKWKMAQHKSRQIAKAKTTAVVNDTPPETHGASNDEHDGEPAPLILMQPAAVQDGRAIAGQKRMKRNRSKTYRSLIQANNLIHDLRRKLNANRVKTKELNIDVRKHNDKKKRGKRQIEGIVIENVRRFFGRDDVSRMTVEKKETITRKV